ncbi:hypothetical protein RIF29_37049 [Crotalaria pallida]|uniref:BHLH domain-containing protein n=1 Tax=Crotalaria pallida TaxID=3830 RepID=A0AAN9EBX6_CROPI
MDMISMMMQMEKFPPELLSCDPFYNNNTLTTSVTDHFSAPAINSPNFFSNVNPTLLNPPPITPSNFSSNPLITPPFQTNPSFPSEKKSSSSMAAMREMIFRVAVMQPIHIDPESVKPPKRRNVKISKDPQSVAARHRRERISERIRILQRLVPGGTKMDTASMLDEAIHYVKFLKKQVQTLEQAGTSSSSSRGVNNNVVGFQGMMPSNYYNNVNYSALAKGCQPC